MEGDRGLVVYTCVNTDLTLFVGSMAGVVLPLLVLIGNFVL
jgi:hypothetical protein